MRKESAKDSAVYIDIFALMNLHHDTRSHDVTTPHCGEAFHRTAARYWKREDESSGGSTAVVYCRHGCRQFHSKGLLSTLQEVMRRMLVGCR